MYATLKDAYRVPTFDVDARRRRAPGVSAVQETAEKIEAFTTLDASIKQMADRPQSSGTSGFGDAYTGRINDYRYACKQFGVCPSTAIEGFENGTPIVNGDAALGKVVNKCEPLQAPPYDYPMSDKDKQVFAKTLAVAVDGKTARPGGDPPSGTDMTHVEAYTDAYGGYDDDDDLDAYLRVNDMKDNITTAKPVRQTPAKFEAAPTTPWVAQTAAAAGAFQDFAPATNAAAVDATTPAASPLETAVAVAKRPSTSKWMDLLIFFSIGVLLIVLMELIFKVAMMTGMRQTVEILLPILKLIESIDKD